MARKTSQKSAKVATKAEAGRAGPKGAKRRETVPKSTSRRVANPALLSGGNPQIAKGYGDAPVQAYIAAMPGWMRRAMASVVATPDNILRATGIGSAVVGLILIWIVRR